MLEAPYVGFLFRCYSNPDEVALEFGEGCEDVEEHPSHGVVGVVDLLPQREAHAALF